MAVNTSSIYQRCFVFSKTQQEAILSVEKGRMSKSQKFNFGTVVVNGVPKVYTEIVTSMERCKYPDAILIAKGDIRKMKFTNPSF